MRWCIAREARKGKTLALMDAIEEVLIKKFSYWRSAIDLGILSPKEQAAQYKKVREGLDSTYHAKRRNAKGTATRTLTRAHTHMHTHAQVNTRTRAHAHTREHAHVCRAFAHAHAHAHMGTHT